MAVQDHRRVETDPSNADAQVVERTSPGNQSLRVFQVLTGACGAALFIFGLIAVFRVDFGASFFDSSGAVAGFGFSPALAIAGIVLGGAIMIASFAAQDRGSAAFMGLVTLAAGIAALVAKGQVSEAADIDRSSALLFVALGAVAFVLSLIPWWSGRTRTTTARNI